MIGTGTPKVVVDGEAHTRTEIGAAEILLDCGIGQWMQNGRGCERFRCWTAHHPRRPRCDDGDDAPDRTKLWIHSLPPYTVSSMEGTTRLSLSQNAHVASATPRAQRADAARKRRGAGEDSSHIPTHGSHVSQKPRPARDPAHMCDQSRSGGSHVSQKQQPARDPTHMCDRVGSVAPSGRRSHPRRSRRLTRCNVGVTGLEPGTSTVSW